MVVPLLAGVSRIKAAYAVSVMFKGNVTFEENKLGGGEEGRAKITVEMRERYFVSRFIVLLIKRIVFADKGGTPTRYTLFQRTGPWRMFVGPF